VSGPGLEHGEGPLDTLLDQIGRADGNVVVGILAAMLDWFSLETRAPQTGTTYASRSAIGNHAHETNRCPWRVSTVVELKSRPGRDRPLHADGGVSVCTRDLERFKRINRS
jgi:hypothetical protein